MGWASQTHHYQVPFLGMRNDGESEISSVVDMYVNNIQNICAIYININIYILYIYIYIYYMYNIYKSLSIYTGYYISKHIIYLNCTSCCKLTRLLHHHHHRRHHHTIL